MKFSSVVICLASCLGTAQAKTPYFLLIGDSTVAVDGGWGDGLLSYLRYPAEGENRGSSGKTTVSWKSDGRWDALLATVEATRNDYEPIVTVQFGHNDQKVMDAVEFQGNMESIVNDLTAAGATPIVITSLTRRTFSGGEVVQNLAEFAAASISAADNTGAQYLGLNLASTNYVNAIGEENAQHYNLASDDRTHLNTAGEVVFGRMTLDLLLEARADLSEYFVANQALSDKIANGEFATGDE